MGRKEIGIIRIIGWRMVGGRTEINMIDIIRDIQHELN